MSSYTRNQIKNYATDTIGSILPLDSDSIAQIVDYALSNLRTRDAVSQHFLNLLGESSKALDFITNFSNMLFGEKNRRSNKQKGEIHSFKETSNTSLQSNGLKTNGRGNAWEYENAAEIRHNQRLKNAPASGTNISELVEKKEKNTKAGELRRKNAKKTLDNLRDLDAALNELELSNDRSNGKSEDVVRVCNCNGTRHPVFQMFPNCLNCGKIICEKEGFQPCSFCGHHLLTNTERLQIIDILKKEKHEIVGSSEEASRSNSQVNHRPKGRKKKVVKISINDAGKNNYRVQELAFKRVERKRQIEKKREELEQQKKEESDEVKNDLKKFDLIEGKDEQLIQAQKRLDTLMGFQANGAERTKIIDQASDFNLPSDSYNLWASPLERALEMKRQQKRLRKQHEDDEKASGRGKHVMNMTIRNGKVYMEEVKEPLNSLDLSDDEDIKNLKDKVNKEKQKSMDAHSGNTWDYEKDATKWQRPVYVNEHPNIKQETVDVTVPKINNMPDSATNQKDAKEPLLKTKPSVVQLGNDQEQQDSIFSMIGV